MILNVSNRWEAKGLWLLAAISDRAGNPSNDELVRKARAAGKAKGGISIPVDLSEDDVRWLLRASRLFDADPDVLGSSEKFGKIYQFGISSVRVKLNDLLRGMGPRESRSAWDTLQEALPQMSLQPTEGERQVGHSPHCVCRGSGRIWVERPGYSGRGSPMSGLEQVPCPEGSLRVNRPSPSGTPGQPDLDDFDF